MAKARARLRVGQILWADLPLRQPPGHEQAGRRPVLVVGVPEDIQAIPYRVLIVVPLTRTRLQGPLFPVLKAGVGGLPVDSTALIYQAGALDAARIAGNIGQLSPADYRPIRDGLKHLLQL